MSRTEVKSISLNESIGGRAEPKSTACSGFGGTVAEEVLVKDSSTGRSTCSTGAGGAEGVVGIVDCVSAGSCGLEEEKGHSDKLRDAPERWANTPDAVAARVVREPITDIGVEDMPRTRLNGVDRACTCEKCRSDTYEDRVGYIETGQDVSIQVADICLLEAWYTCI